MAIFRDLKVSLTDEEWRAAFECYERHDDRRFVVELFRGDTGELVESRPMSATERSAALQATLPNVVTRNDGEPS